MATYYIKNGGNDLADGLSDANAWATLTKVNSITFAAGDFILFRRGDTFRGSIYQAENGSSSGWITYGAYGIGFKPLIIGAKDISTTSDWTLHAGNVWKTSATLGTNQNDISNLVFNYEASVGIKRNSLAGCDSQGKFFYNTTDHLLYIYSTSNPGTFYTHIEACGHHDVNQGLLKWTNSSYVCVQNLDVRYSSAAGIEFGLSNHFIVEYCNVSWIGGEWLNAGGADRVRLGNGISMINSVSDGIIRFNRVDQCYDAGISPQGWTAGYVQSDIAQYGNVVTNCYYSYEGYGAATGCSMIRVNFYNNTCKDAGNCWSNNSDQRPDYVNSRHVMIWKEDGTHTDCNIKNNIFSGTCTTAIRINEDDSYPIKHIFDNNLYNVTTVASTYHGILTTLAQWQATESQDPHGISADPLFVSASDLHLTSTSPAINAGVDVGLSYRDVAPDIGAYEYFVGKTRNSSTVWSSANLKQYSSFPEQADIITGTDTIDCKNLKIGHLSTVLTGPSTELFELCNLAGTFVEGGEAGKVNAWARYKPGQTAYNVALPAACDANPTFTYTPPGSPPGAALGDFAGYYHEEDTRPVYWGSPHQAGEYVIYSTTDIIGGLSRGRLGPILSSDVEDETYWSWVRVQAWLKENSGAYSLIGTSALYDWLADPAPTLFVMGSHGETAGNTYTLCLRPIYVDPNNGTTPLAVCEGGVEILTYHKWGTAEDVADTFTVDVNTITSYDLGGGWLHMRIDYDFNINNLMTNALDCDVRLRVTDNSLAWQQDFIIGYGVHINASSSLNFADTNVEITETIVDDGTCTVNVQVSFDSGVSWVTIGVLSSTLPSYNNI